MFCDKPHINQLTALLKGHGFKDIVVCPGSRNGILVHNFHEAGFRLHPVTDERSAAFVALGLSLATHQPVAVCVTSGSALLNTIPAVAEAYFRQLPLLVISADRPKQWIGQLDGQTLFQDGALQPYAQTYTIMEASTAEEEHWNNLQANQAILSLHFNGGQPAHLNVPITEPLFSFHTESLPSIRMVREETSAPQEPFSAKTIERIENAKFPIIIMGQYEKHEIAAIDLIERQGAILFLPELIAGQRGCWRTTALEHLLPDNSFTPDLVIHIGGNLVNKQLKLFLRKCDKCEVIRVEPGQTFPDTFAHLSTIVRSTPKAALEQLGKLSRPNPMVQSYQAYLDGFRGKADSYAPICFSDLGVLQAISRNLPNPCAIQVGNSSVVRNAAYFMEGHTKELHCNRGVNGIEGSLSVAVGYAKGHQGLTFSFIGDLSFFYDQNALWNKELPKNLRIVLFNNGGGQIFYRLPGLNATPALSPYIAAAHTTQAKGIAETYGLDYREAHSYQELQALIPTMMETDRNRPMLLEIFTNTEDNEKELKQLKQYYQTL